MTLATTHHAASPANPESPALPLTTSELRNLAGEALAHAKQLGASSAEVEVSTSVGQSVTVRLNEVETIEYNRDKGLSVTVYFGQKKGSASTSDLSLPALQRAVAAACGIARFTASDDFAGLADPARLARSPWPALALNQPWHLSVEAAIEIARRIEAAGFAVDKRIDNSEGASVSSHEGEFIYANSNGFMGGYPSSRASLSASLIASEGEAMQRDYWYTTGRGLAALEAPESVGRTAGQRTAARLGAKRLPSGHAAVLFDPQMAAGLIGHFVGAASGGALYRKSSFLLESLGQPVFSKVVSITEAPHLEGALASAPFDNEGVATSPRELVQAGVLQGYFLASYSARKLGMVSTGNAGGNHNLVVHPGTKDFAALVREMGTGLIVTELMGQGINNVTGDYSRGAAGFWVEGGEIVHAVEEITIAGNLKEMFQAIVAVGNDVQRLGSKHTGSILIERMAIAGD